MKKRYTVLLYIDALLLFLCAAVLVVGLYVSGPQLKDIVYMVLCLFLLYYGISGYKWAGGRMLKYLMLGFDAALLVLFPDICEVGLCPELFLLPLIMAGIGYVAGRLEHIRENRYIMTVLLAGLSFVSVCGWLQIRQSAGAVQGLVELFPAVFWLILCSAVVMRSSRS